MIEPDADAVCICAGLPKKRTGILDGFVVGERASRESKALGYSLFVGGMHVIGIADVDRHSHGGVGGRERAALRIANDSPVLASIRSEGRELNEEEREVALMPLRAPIGDERREFTRVQRRIREP